MQLSQSNSAQEQIEEINETELIEILSDPINFEAIIYNFFSKRELSESFPKYNDKEERVLFLNENIPLIIYNLKLKEKSRVFIEYLKELYQKKGLQFDPLIIDKLIKPILIFIRENTPVNIEMQNKLGNNYYAVSPKILQIAERFGISIENILSNIKFDEFTLGHIKLMRAGVVFAKINGDTILSID